jgi:hypothetical protein
LLKYLGGSGKCEWLALNNSGLKTVVFLRRSEQHQTQTKVFLLTPQIKKDRKQSKRQAQFETHSAQHHLGLQEAEVFN